MIRFYSLLWPYALSLYYNVIQMILFSSQQSLILCFALLSSCSSHTSNPFLTCGCLSISYLPLRTQHCCCTLLETFLDHSSRLCLLSSEITFYCRTQWNTNRRSPHFEYVNWNSNFSTCQMQDWGKPFPPSASISSNRNKPETICLRTVWSSY